jgi:glycine/D-amino acid oxidase-like deaminating enzyme/nitrite reductase/ring-hydroxylating ferredoxin subunit
MSQSLDPARAADAARPRRIRPAEAHAVNPVDVTPDAALTGPMTSLWRADAAPVSGTEFAPGRRYDVVVVGAGITGLTTALMLTRAGRSVAVVEAGEVGHLATGANTGKLSLLQGTVLSRLRRSHPASLVRAYVDANRDGAAWLTAFADAAGVTYTRRTAYTYAQSDAGVADVEREFAAASEAGLDVRRLLPEGGTPFAVVDAVALEEQVAIDPQAVAVALARAFVAEGGTLHTRTRVTRAHAVPSASVDTPAGSLTAGQVVLATAAPIAVRGLYFVKTRGLRSYCVAFDVPGEVPDGLYLSADDPTRSVRSVTRADGPGERANLVVGGNGHAVGRVDSERERVDDLIAWTRRHFPGAEPRMRWSAQDYESLNLIPFVGALPRGLGRIRVATGYGKWGLSNGPAAALRLTAEITGVPWRDRPEWMNRIARRVTPPADFVRGGVENMRVGWELAAGRIAAQRQPVPVPRPEEGQGVLASRGGSPVGVSTVDGTTRAASAVCTHLGGTVSWNDAECTWDCPLHASRFAPDGTRIEGPATRDLRPLPRSGPPIDR